MTILIIYLVGTVVSIIISYYRVYMHASDGEYFELSALLMCITMGMLSWFGFILMLLITLYERDYKLLKIK